MKIENVNTYTSNKTILQVVNSTIEKTSFQKIIVKKTTISENPIIIDVEITIKCNDFRDELESLEQKINEDLLIVFGENDYRLRFKLITMVENESK